MTNLWVSYLSLKAAPPSAAPRCDARLEARRLAVKDYLALYRYIGSPWGWDQRLRMPQDGLAAFLASSRCHIYALIEVADGCTIGLCEFDCSSAPDVQLMNFGLVPHAFGRGLGPWFLNEALRAVWAETSPQRIWLHTDTRDHPKARDVYLSSGFEIDEERWEDATEL